MDSLHRCVGEREREREGGGGETYHYLNLPRANL